MHSMSQRAIAEMFGTAALVLVGPGSVIATLTLAGKAVPAVTEADLLAISFAFGFIITALVYAIGKVSGCHINPAVTFALAVTRRFPWKEVPVYWGAQYVGAIIGAFAIWGVFGQNAVTFGMGQTHFAADASSSYYLQAALAEALGTGLLIFAILGIVDSKSPSQLAGIVIGGAVGGIILIFGPITGASLNPSPTTTAPRALSPTSFLTEQGENHNGSRNHPDEKVPQRPGDGREGVAGRPRRSALRPSPLRRREPDHRAQGRAEEGQGGPDLGRWLRTRTAARRLRGPGHAGRGLPGRGVHLTGTRPDARCHKSRGRRRGRRAHRQELHGRRAQLQARS